MGVISNGTTLIDNGALDPAVPSGSLILLSTQTASNSATISFTTGLDSTYDSYVFNFIDINPATDNTEFLFNMSTDAGANYNVTKTTTLFRAFHAEADNSAGLGYLTSYDLAQSTAFQPLTFSSGNGADESCSGTLTLFNPSSTTYVKNFIANVNYYSNDNFTVNVFTAGYGNTTSAVNAVQFKMLSGNFDGIIKLYGVK
jgi:hypothetical protein